MTITIAAVLKSSLVLAVTLLAVQFCRSRSAALRHMIWTAGLIGALVLPLLAGMLPSWHVPLGAPAVHYLAAPPSPQDDGGTLQNVIGVTAPAPAQWSGLQLLIKLWKIGVLTGLLLMAIEFIKLGRAAAGSEAISEPRTREIAEFLGLKVNARLMRTSQGLILGTWGVFRPSVLLPAESAHWSDGQLRAVLAHEIAHIRRFDWPVQMIAELARAVYWFNPLFWIACRQIRFESELACDDAALGSGIEGPAYADHLLELARLMRDSRQSAAALAMARSSDLERRLISMLNPSINRRGVSRRTIGMTLLAMAAMLLPLAAMQASRPVVIMKAAAALGERSPKQQTHTGISAPAIATPELASPPSPKQNLPISAALPAERQDQVRTVASVLTTILSVALAESPFEGRWESHDPNNVILVFQINGQKLSGTFSLADLPGQAPQPLEGKVDGEFIAFSVQTKDKARIIAFYGKLAGNSIELQREATGDPPPNGGSVPPIFALDGPKTVTFAKMK